mmetsp:Transcript_647/g.829  ORF Transcript_647/g.829 Transcript_647/m.829 type:complete len:93 (-) Transcript_647:705-983(-)
MNRGQVLALYRKFLREARKMQDYNMSSYFERRARHGFREKMYVKTAEEREAAYRYGMEEFGVLQRCVFLSNLYPSSESVMRHPSFKSSSKPR